MEIFEGDIGSRVSRLEVINTGRRRRFTEDEKLRIVAESFAGRGLASATARQYGISRSLLNRWRKSVRQGLLGHQQTDGFVPAFVTPETFMPVKQATACQRRSKNRPRGGAKVGHCGAGLRPPGGLKPERGSRAGVAIFREVFSLPFGRGFGRDDSCRRSSRGC